MIRAIVQSLSSKWDPFEKGTISNYTMTTNL